MIAVCITHFPFDDILFRSGDIRDEVAKTDILVVSVDANLDKITQNLVGSSYGMDFTG